MNWKIHLYRAILWLITLSLLLMMFGFSAQEGTQSGSISDKIARPITDSLAQRQGLTGLLLAMLVLWLIRRRRAKKQST